MEDIIFVTEEGLNELSTLLAEDHPGVTFSRQDLTHRAYEILGPVWAVFRSIPKDDLPVIEY